jgi:hypothetical protein
MCEALITYLPAVGNVRVAEPALEVVSGAFGPPTLALEMLLPVDPSNTSNVTLPPAATVTGASAEPATVISRNPSALKASYAQRTWSLALFVSV